MPAEKPVSPAPEGGVAPHSRRVMNLAQLLTQNARRFPALPGLIWRDRSWSWAEIETEVSALAAALAARGVRKGDRVFVHSKNCPQMLWTMFATFRLGAVWVPTNFRLMPEELVYLATFSGAKAFICHADFPEHAETVMRAAPDIAFLWRIEGDAPMPEHAAQKWQPVLRNSMRQSKEIEHGFDPIKTKRALESFGEASLDEMIARHRGALQRHADVDYDDPCWFFFTSGTTGKSKAAVLTHGQMAFVITNHLADLLPGTTEADASLVVAPLSHGAGVHQLNIIARGAPTILLPSDRFDIEEAFRLIAHHRITNMFTVPTILKLLAEHPAAKTADHSSLKHVIYAGAPMYREDQKTALRVLGKVIVQYFGLGEVTGNITVLPPALHDPDDRANTKFGTCGFARTGMQISIQDDAGSELEPNVQGEICVAGPAVFAGYYNNPEANAKAFRNGWFRTGDLGHLDEEGFLYITGRASDMYISGGSNIYPREIEEKILTHPAIAEVAVVGVPDRLWGEVGIAVCVLREGENADEAAISAFLNGKINRYKLPKRVFFWEALPKSGYGKIPKRLVRDALEARGLLEGIDAPGKS